MKEINVHEFSNGLNDTFRRYLATTNLIADTEPGLREEIWKQLGEYDFFARRPLVTSIPAYKPALAGDNLVGAATFPSLSKLLTKLNSNELDLRRPLYQHQVDALEKAQNGRNIIVATGTGSGKTECFLLPVLDDAAQYSDTGVRTIIVYPMNALANDQVDRLRRLLKDLPEITFGRYTGETPRTVEEINEEDRKKILVNERYTRQEIKDNSPHILLTNFAMLEYLLLRPSDNNIFRHQSLRYVVLDEAHTYSGAQGIDISLLMRRLSQRYEKNDLQFILTSATLSEDETDDSRIKIAQFGKSLTGANFEFNDVIFGEAVHGFDDDLKAVSSEQIFAAVPTEESLQKWLDALENPETLKNLINQTGFPNKEKINKLNEPGKILYELFRDWLPVRQVYDLVSENAYSFDELTQKLWERDDLNATLALKWLLTLAARAKKDANQPPLISARFHFFFRGLTGASVCLNPDCGCANVSNSTVKRIYLESRNQCQPTCESMLLPLSTCFQCGLPAVDLWLDENNRKWKALKPSNNRDQIPPRLFLTWDNSISETDETDETEDEQNADLVELCLKCNSISLDGKLNDCCSNPIKISLKRIAAGKDNNIKTCPRCGSDARPYPSVLREFRSGDDAVTAVLAEQIMRHLPEEENSESLPAGGRKMLAFSDSRQRAAFFAPYLKRTTAETEYSQPLYGSLLTQESKNDDEAVTIDEITRRFVKTATDRKQIVLREYNEEQENDTYRFIATRDMQKSDEKNLRRQAEITLLKHFCASARQRTTWSGLGLAAAEIELTRGDKEDLQKSLPEIFRADELEGWDFIQQLLQIFLMRKALFIEDDEISNKDLGKGAREVTFHSTLNDSVSGRQRIRWNPYRAAKIQKRTIPNSYQANVVGRFLGLDVKQDAAQVDEWLERIWNAFRETVFRQYQSSGGEYQIDAGKIVISTRRNYAFCDSCGRLTTHYAKGYCVMPKCDGRLKKITSADLEEKLARYHYRHRVLNNKPMALNVVEHTAQLTNRRGQEYQQKFIKGEINVLSSSTTFEMGVDVGGLKAVLLRNVPPTASNYIQRAGRAGRRRDGAAYAVTYSRALPHDQYHFHHPSSVVRGKVPIPLINLKNTRLAKRHVNSFLLGEFLRFLPVDSATKNVSDFFLSPSESESLFEKFKDFVELNQGKLAKTVKFILPEENSLEAEECIKSSVQKLKEVYTEKIKEFLDSFKKQHDEVSSQKATADTSQLGKIKYALESIERLINQLQTEPLINFLSSAHWLPSYAFPQDTIRLFVRQSQYTERMRLERDREQGISEYAPGAEIIADGKLFKSGGVMRPHRGFDIRKYRYCRQCRRLKTVNSTENIAPTCDCGTFCQINDYIVPAGFQTLYNEKVEEPNLFRLTPPSSTEISLISGTDEKDFRFHDKIAGISYGYRRDGRLFRANAGYNFNKFRLCRECGKHFEKTVRVDNRGHETPWGTRCFGTLFNTHLAHEFETDILQLRFNLIGKVTPPVVDSEFWLSLTSAFISAAAEALTIPRNDLDAIYQSQNINETQGEIILYDKVPGGAGYVERIIENIPIVLQRVLARTINCENPLCDENSSCYTCLRNYQNQFYWDRLQRKKVSDWLYGVSLNAVTTNGKIY